jgi:hypothetical protein
MTLFNGLNLWTDSVDTVKKDIADTPIGDEIWDGGSSGMDIVYLKLEDGVRRVGEKIEPLDILSLHNTGWRLALNMADSILARVGHALE